MRTDRLKNSLADFGLNIGDFVVCKYADHYRFTHSLAMCQILKPERFAKRGKFSMEVKIVACSKYTDDFYNRTHNTFVVPCEDFRLLSHNEVNNFYNYKPEEEETYGEF